MSLTNTGCGGFLKTRLFQTDFLEVVLATRRAKKEYSGQLGSQNGTKIDTKMEPRRRRPTLTKHAQASSDCLSPPLTGTSILRVFQTPTKYPPKDRQKSTILKYKARTVPKMDSSFAGGRLRNQPFSRFCPCQPVFRES